MNDDLLNFTVSLICNYSKNVSYLIIKLLTFSALSDRWLLNTEIQLSVSHLHCIKVPPVLRVIFLFF